MPRREGSWLCQNPVGCQLSVKPSLKTQGRGGGLETFSPFLIKMMAENRTHIEASFMPFIKKYSLNFFSISQDSQWGPEAERVFFTVLAHMGLWLGQQRGSPC